MTRGFPQGQATQVFPSPDGSELSFRRMARGFPSASWLKVFPLPVAPDSSLPEGPDLSFAGWRRALPRPEASKLPIAGGPGFPPNRVARSFLLAYGAGLLLARRPGLALCRVARGFPSAGYRPGGRRISTPIAGDRTRGFGQQFQDSLAVHKPSTVNPRLSPATGLSPPNTPQDDPQGV